MEHAYYGNLRSFIGKTSMIDKYMVKWTFNIAEALSYLHSQNPSIFHKDLKTSNVLVRID
jgi:serine/threonine protein kinase